MTLSITALMKLGIMTLNAYAECHYVEYFMLSVTVKYIMLSVNLLNVVMLNVVAP